MISIFVAKLDFGVDNDQLKALFSEYGRVNKATVAFDRETKKSRGFGFVEMADREEGLAAINALNDFQVNGRPIAVKEAEDRGGQKKGGFTPRPGGDRPRSFSSDQGDTRSERPSKPASTGGGFRPSADDISTPDVAGKPEMRKKDKEPRKKEKVKTHKMEAYKKSGKGKQIFFDDDDDEDIPGLFDFPEDDE